MTLYHCGLYLCIGSVGNSSVSVMAVLDGSDPGYASDEVTAVNIFNVLCTLR